jgi:hypothetical protein
MISPQRRAEVIEALEARHGAQGWLRCTGRGLWPASGNARRRVGRGGVRTRRLQGYPRRIRFGQDLFRSLAARTGSSARLATSEVQISETETPLHRLETVYRRLVERIATADSGEGAFRGIVDGWFYALERDVLEDTSLDPTDEACLARQDRGADGGEAGQRDQGGPGLL